jgi:hypothetical protein
MAFERVSQGAERAGDPFSTAAESVDTRSPGLSPAVRLQILSTEHWSLIASRSLAWNETFSRAGMFLSTLSGAMVALALVAQASAFGRPFFLFALLILPIVLFVGITTFLRLGAANYHDGLCVAGMNRIRGAYLELAPELEPYFIMSAHDDVRGIGLTMGVDPGGNRLAHLLAGTPTVVMVLNSVLVGVIACLLVLQFDPTTGVALAVGAGGFLVTMALHVWYGHRSVSRAQATFDPLFPTPDRETRAR